MALGVVHGLQLVEVEDHQRERSLVTPAPGDLGVELLNERASVEQVRERIVVGEETHLFELLGRVHRGRRLVCKDA